MDAVTLKKLQQCEAGILSFFDTFCTEHHLKYSLFAGTALGAVRHKGFIPWDDDIDVCMERNEYEKFVALWKAEKNKPYYFQDPEEDSSRINHAKIRKEGTVLASKEEMQTEGHHGVWLDIFPLDKIPTEKRLRKKFLFVAKLRLVYTRGYPVKNRGRALKFLSAVMLILPRKLQISVRKKCDKYIKKYQDRKDKYALISLASPEELGIVFPSDMMESFHACPFEMYHFQLTDRYEKMLDVTYGDYMKLPPEEERVCRHNPEVIAF